MNTAICLAAAAGTVCGALLASAVLYAGAIVLWAWWRARAERAARRKAALARDMESMDERRKRELVQHNRRQLWLEYVSEEDNHDEEKSA